MEERKRNRKEERKSGTAREIDIESRIGPFIFYFDGFCCEGNNNNFTIQYNQR